MAETWRVESPGSSSSPVWRGSMMGFPDERLRDIAAVIVCMVAMIANGPGLHYNQQVELEERPNPSLTKRQIDYFEVDHDVHSFDDDWDDLWEDPYTGTELHGGNEKSATATKPPDAAEKVSSDPTSKSTGTNQKSSLSKRPRRDSEEGDDNDPRNWRINKHPKLDGDLWPLHFACPYFRRNPTHYGDCFRYKLKHIADVKQHLKRNHRQPTHCNICLEELPSEDALHDHIRAQQCRKRAYIAPDGMTSLQEKRVISRVGNRKKPVAEQWFEIYDILFPGVPKPEFVYLGDQLAEGVESFRQFVSRQGLKMIVQELKGSNIQGGDDQELEGRLQNAFSNMFDVFLNRQNAPRDGKNYGQSSGLGTTSQRREGAVGRRTESGSGEEDTTSVLYESLELENEAFEDEILENDGLDGQGI